MLDLGDARLCFLLEIEHFTRNNSTVNIDMTDSEVVS